MKTFKLLTMAFTAALLCAGLQACSDDNGGESDGGEFFYNEDNIKVDYVEYKGVKNGVRRYLVFFEEGALANTIDLEIPERLMGSEFALEDEIVTADSGDPYWEIFAGYDGLAYDGLGIEDDRRDLATGKLYIKHSGGRVEIRFEGNYPTRDMVIKGSYKGRYTTDGGGGDK